MQEVNDVSGIIELEKWMAEHNCKAIVSVHKNRNDFWWTKEERQHHNVATGYSFCGAGDPYPMTLHSYITSNSKPTPTSHERSAFNVKNVYVDIKFTMSTKNADQLVNNKLNLTANPMGGYHSSWTIYKDTKRVPVTYGIYKPEGFIEAYLANKKLKPNLSELKFATKSQITPLEFEDMKVSFQGKREKWDTDVVDIRAFDEPHNLIHKFTEYEDVDSGTSTVTLSLIGPDIIKNLDYIKGILSAHC